MSKRPAHLKPTPPRVTIPNRTEGGGAFSRPKVVGATIKASQVQRVRQIQGSQKTLEADRPIKSGELRNDSLHALTVQQEPKTATGIVQTSKLETGKALAKCDSVASSRLPRSQDVQSNHSGACQAHEVSLQPQMKPYLADQSPILEINSFMDKAETNVLESEPNAEYAKFGEQFQETSYFGDYGAQSQGARV